MGLKDDGGEQMERKGGPEVQQVFLRKVRDYVREVLGIEKGSDWVLAVSGGPDSMVLLDALARLRSELGLGLVVAHVNHGLRAEADAEQRFVEEQAGLRGLRCVSFVRDVRGLRRPGQSLEECARQVRYACLEEVCRDVGASGILVAHHRDDAAETVLLHLLRGTGLNGLQGILPVRGRIFRPLLCVERREIMEYARAVGLPFCVDLSNGDFTYTRNRIRGVLLPLLKEQFNPRIGSALLRLADLASADEQALQVWLEELWPGVCAESSEERVVLKVDGLKKLPLGMQRRMVRRSLAFLRGESGWTAQDVEDVLGLLEKSGSDVGVQLKKGVWARKVYRELLLEGKGPERVLPFCVRVRVPGGLKVAENGRVYRFSVVEKGPDWRLLPGIKLDAERLPEGLWLRNRRPGDRLAPAGGVGSKKLKDWLMDRKVPVWERDALALLCGEDGVVYAVCGMAAAAVAAVTEGSSWVLVVEEWK